MGRRGRRILLASLLALVAAVAAAYALVWLPVAPAYAFLRGLEGSAPTESDLVRAGGRRLPADGARGRAPVRYLPPPDGGPAPILVVVAGVTPAGIDDPRVWRLLLALRAAGFAVLAPDVPGLRRLGEDHDVVTWVRDALVMASKARDLGLPGADPDRIGILGVSLGGSLALRAAATSPVRVRALLLVGAPDDPRTLAPAWFREPVAPAGAAAGAVLRSGAGLFARHGVLRAAAGPLLPAAESASVREWIDRVGEAPASGGPPPPALASAEGARWVRAALAEDRPDPADLAWALAAAEPGLALFAPAAWDDELAGLRAPAWLVHGTDDPLVPASEMDRLAARLARRVPVRTLRSALLTHVDVGSPGLVEAWRHLRLLTDAFEAVRGGGS